MPKRSVTAILSAVVLFAGISGYAIADINDQVPGLLTRKAPESPAPIPVASVAAPAPTWPTQMQVNLPALTSAHVKPLWDKLTLAAQNIETDIKAQKAQNGAATQTPPPIGQVRVGAYVIDALTGNVLLNGNGQVPMQPASTTKVLTGFTIARSLDPQMRLATTTHLSPDGAIHLTGEGDMMLSAGDANPSEVSGYAGLRQLATETARQLKARGAAPTQLVYHDQIFDGPALEPTLEGGLLEWVTKASAFATKLNDTTQKGVPTPIDEPGLQVAQTLAQLLSEEGVNVVVKPGNENFDTTSSQTLAQVHSATVEQITRLMLRESDNTLAEQLCRLAAQASGYPSDFSGASKHVLETVQAQGIEVDGLVLHDCSGLNENNRIPPRLTAQVLLHALNHNPDLMRSLPYAWFDGTLATRFNTANTAPWVVAKTGSLDESASLAGYATTKSGRVLVFQVQVDNAKDGAWVYRPILDAFASDLAELP